MLYEDDSFHPNHLEFTDIKNKHLLDDEFKKENLYIVKFIHNDQKIKRKCYFSGGVNTPIIDAVTGEPYSKYLVGSRHEDQFFKNRISNIGTFFYQTPEEYERHLCLTLSNEIKVKWLERQRV
jgi:hypothetical protein